MTWIIGNGFDLTVGLRTQYKEFLDRVYFARDKYAQSREKLEGIVGKRCDWHDTAWSDLEALLGKATRGFQADDDEFDLIFEEMQQAFVDYVNAEQKRLPDILPTELVEEFWDSVCAFPKRLVEVDQESLPVSDGYSGNIGYRFISLNYTTVFDRFLESAREAHSPFRSRVVGVRNYVDDAEKPLHLHGMIEGDEPRNIIFGVASAEMLANQEFAQSARQTELWVKLNKNHSLFGNNKSARAKSVIDSSGVICIFGSSLGDSDAYIWEMIGARLKSDSSAMVVLFDYSLPDRYGQEGLRYQTRRDELRREFLRKAGLDITSKDSVDSQDDYSSRIITVPPKAVFNIRMLSDSE